MILGHLFFILILVSMLLWIINLRITKIFLELYAALWFIYSLIYLHLENIFDWNVKQLFLYLSAEYSTKNNVSTCVEVCL